MTKFTVPKSAFPNTLTALNLFCGFLSVVFADKMELGTASIFILAAAVFDSLDGIAARLVKVASRFGVELDSLADVVSFGAAPSFLIYKAYFESFGWIGIVVSSLPAIFGAFRLARFNITLTNIESKGDFTGLPIPLQAVTISFLVISFYSTAEKAISAPVSYFVFPLVILLSLLMVSKIRYNALPKLKNKSIFERFVFFAVLAAAIALAYVTNGLVLFYFFIAIVLFGILREIFVKLFASN